MKSIWNPIVRQIPLPGRDGREKLNGTILFLSSDASSYVTSQHILVDGGYTII